MSARQPEFGGLEGGEAALAANGLKWGGANWVEMTELRRRSAREADAGGESAKTVSAEDVGNHQLWGAQGAVVWVRAQTR